MTVALSVFTLVYLVFVFTMLSVGKLGLILVRWFSWCVGGPVEQVRQSHRELSFASGADTAVRR